MEIPVELQTLLHSVGFDKKQDRLSDDLWYCQLATALTSANQPALVVKVYQVAVESNTTEDFVGHVFRRMKEALLKGALIYGVPQLLNAFYPLCRAHEHNCDLIREQIPDASKLEDPLPGTEFVRQGIFRPQDVEERGLSYLSNMYRDDLPRMIQPLERFSQDIYQFSLKFTYGYWLSEDSILTAKETASICISTLIPLDLPVQVGWHSRGLLRNGGNLEDLQRATLIGIKTAETVGKRLEGELPTLAQIESERLFQM